MSFPLLRISDDYAHVEIRKGRGIDRWDDMEEIFTGAAEQGQEWRAGEGAKLSAKHCMMPDDPGSTLSLPVTVSGQNGLAVGEPRVRVFPHAL